MREAHEALKVVINLELGELSEGQQEALEKLADMFEPYEGDAAREASKRLPNYLRCSNCDHEWEGFYAPALMTKVISVGMRLAVCPRCFATKKIMIGGTK